MLSSQNLGERVLRHQFLLRRLFRPLERGQQWRRRHHLLWTRLGQDRPDLSPQEDSRPEDQTHTLLSPRLHTQPLDDGIQRVRNENTKAINSICFFSVFKICVSVLDVRLFPQAIWRIQLQWHSFCGTRFHGNRDIVDSWIRIIEGGNCRSQLFFVQIKIEILFST